MEKIFGENSNWSIFIMSIIFYSFVYYRRIGRGIREIKIPSFLENVLFPFSKEGKAALGCIIIALYLVLSVPFSYVAIFVLKVATDQVNCIWYLGLEGICFLGGGAGIMHECVYKNKNIIVKIIMGIMSCACIYYGFIWLKRMMEVCIEMDI